MPVCRRGIILSAQIAHNERSCDILTPPWPLPTAKHFHQSLTSLSTDVPPDVLRDFVTRMDDDYLRRIPLQTIAQHVGLAAKLTPEHLCECTVFDRGDGHFDLTSSPMTILPNSRPSADCCRHSG